VIQHPLDRGLPEEFLMLFSGNIRPPTALFEAIYPSPQKAIVAAFSSPPFFKDAFHNINHWGRFRYSGASHVGPGLRP
jgi:hypothetical protein